MMLLLYHEGGDNQYSEMLDDVPDQNFVMLDTLPYADLNPELEFFNDKCPSEYAYFSDALWLYPYSEQGPDPDCPMCDGTGDLSRFRGQIPDTRRWMGPWN